MKRTWMTGVALLFALSGCGGDLLVKLAEAVTPTTLTEARQELAAALDALEVMDDFSSFSPVSLKTGAGTTFAAKGAALARSLAMQQDVSLPGISGGGSSYTIDCELGGTLTISGDSTASADSGRVTLRANECRESNGDGTTTLSDGTVRIRFEGSGTPGGSNYEFRMTMTIRGTFQDFDAAGELIASEIADLESTWDGKVDTTGLDEAVSSLDTTDVTEDDLSGFEDSIAAAFRFTITIDGGLELQDDSEPCASGVYAFDTVEPLVYDVTRSGCGYSGGILKINGVTYSFGASDVTVSGPGYNETVLCAELTSSDICEAPAETTDTP